LRAALDGSPAQTLLTLMRAMKVAELQFWPGPELAVGRPIARRGGAW
jgi:hypothetical protein